MIPGNIANNAMPFITPGKRLCGWKNHHQEQSNEFFHWTSPSKFTTETRRHGDTEKIGWKNKIKAKSKSKAENKPKPEPEEVRETEASISARLPPGIRPETE